MENLTREIEKLAKGYGMDLVTFADISALPQTPHTVGIAVGVALEPALVASLLEAPSQHYYNEYNRIYDLQDEVVEACAALLHGRDYGAFAQSRKHLRAEGLQDDATNSTSLPHKTVARLGGMGWIGRCALLVTPEYGSAVRISSLTTDAPLAPSSMPGGMPGCGGCTACVDICPAGAVKGPAWAGVGKREDIYDADACKQAARALSRKHIEGLPGEITLCGKCIAICPHTQRYLRSQGVRV